MVSLTYEGSELALFAKARRWKCYWGAQIRPYLRGDVLEVGAGLGANTRALFRESDHPSWLCLEPDASLAASLRDGIAEGRLPARCRAVEGTLDVLPDDATFDAILYADVLEHIADDRGQLAGAGAHLRPGGRLIVLSPAHEALYSPFDAAIGHHRRYDRSTVRRISPPGLELVCLRYLDAAGLLTSLANRALLRQAMPTQRQILFWDRVLVRISLVIDPLLCYRIGRSILAVWLLPAETGSSR